MCSKVKVFVLGLEVNIRSVFYFCVCVSVCDIFKEKNVKSKKSKGKFLPFAVVADDKRVSRKLRSRKLRPQTSDLRPQTSDLRPQTPKLGSRKFRPLEIHFLKTIYIVNSSQFLSPDNLWSRNVHRQPPERKKRYIYLQSSPVYRCRVDQTV